MLYHENSAFALAMHLEIKGRPSRIVMLEGFIQPMRSHNNIWFGRRDRSVDDLRSRLKRGGVKQRG